MKRIFLRVCALLVFYLFTSLFSINLEGKNPVCQNFRLFTSKDGFYAERIRQIEQDKYGFLWIATMEGLIKYDGHDFKTFDSEQENSKNLTLDIPFILKDKNNNLWIANAKGVTHLQIQKGQFNNITFPNHREYYVKSLALDAGGKILAGTDKGVFIIDTNFLATPLLKSNNEKFSFASVLSIGSNQVWVVTHNFIYKYSAQDFVLLDSIQYTEDKTITDNFQTASAMDSFGNLWIGKYNGEIFRFNTHQNKLFKYDLKVVTNNPSAIINQLTINPKGELWTSIDESGIWYFDYSKDKFLPFVTPKTTQHSLSSYKISCYFEDREKNTWFGITKSGLVMTNPHLNMLGRLKIGSASGSQIVSAVLKDRNNQLWIGTDGGGLHQYDANKGWVHHFTTLNSGIGNDAVMSIFEDSKNRLWIGTFRGGLSLLDRKTNTFKRYVHQADNPNSLIKNDVRKIIEDHEGNLWLAVHGKGVVMFNPEKETFTNYVRIASVWTVDVLIDREENVWLAGDKGISKKKKSENVFRDFFIEPLKHSMKDNSFNCLAEDRQGNIWLGTNRGMYRTNKACDSITEFKAIPQLGNSSIKTITPIDKNILLVSTNKGLFQINEITGQCVEFKYEDGLPSEDFVNNSSFLFQNSTLFLGTSNGLCWIDFAGIQPLPNPPPPYITNVDVFNKSIFQDNSQFVYGSDSKPLKSIELAYDQNHLTFQLACPTFIQSFSHMQFEYQMEGLDQNWQRTSDSRGALYSSLPPGNYTFKVRAVQNGYLESSITSLEVIIHPPFWETWWFRAFVLLAAVSSFYWYFRFKTNSVVKYNKELEEKIKERTEQIVQKNQILQDQHNQLELANNAKDRLFSIIAHDLRSPFGAILALADLLQKHYDNYAESQRKEIFQHIRKASANAFSILENLLQWASSQTGRITFSPDWVSISAFLVKMEEMYSLVAKEKNIQIEVHLDESFQAYVDPNMLETILRNLLNNAIKFTQRNGLVSLQAILTSKGFDIMVTDNGTGMEQSMVQEIQHQSKHTSLQGTDGEKGTGIGLMVVKEFLEYHLASWEIHSKKGEGTEFLLHFPCETKREQVDKKLTITENREDEIPDVAQFITKNELESVKGKKILIVDDQLEIRKSILLNFHDYFDILEAENGDEAFYLAKDAMPDLIVSDVMMPGGNGLDFSRKLRQNVSTRHIPIILLTSQIEEIDVINGLQTGVDDYLTKPFNPQLLLLKIVKLLINRELLIKKFRIDDQPFIDHLSENSLDNQWLRRVEEIIEQNISEEDFGVEALSEKVGMHRTNLSKKITSLTGQSPQELIKVQRMKRAAVLLLTSGLNVSEVAYEVGYSDPKYFSRSFKSYYGVLPTDYV